MDISWSSFGIAEGSFCRLNGTRHQLPAIFLVSLRVVSGFYVLRDLFLLVLKKLWKTLKSQKDALCDQIRDDINLVESEASAMEKEEAHAEREAQRIERRNQQQRWDTAELFQKQAERAMEYTVDKLKGCS